MTRVIKRPLLLAINFNGHCDAWLFLMDSVLLNIILTCGGCVLILRLSHYYYSGLAYVKNRLQKLVSAGLSDVNPDTDDYDYFSLETCTKETDKDYHRN